MAGFNSPSVRAREVQRLQVASLTAAMQHAMEMVAWYANSEHSYTRRTGETEATTVGGVREATAEKIVGVVSSGMDYDVFLSLIKDGKWSYLWPAMLAHQEEVMAILGEAGLGNEGRK